MCIVGNLNRNWLLNSQCLFQRKLNIEYAISTVKKQKKKIENGVDAAMTDAIGASIVCFARSLFVVFHQHIQSKAFYVSMQSIRYAGVKCNDHRMRGKGNEWVVNGANKTGAGICATRLCFSELNTMRFSIGEPFVLVILDGYDAAFTI